MQRNLVDCGFPNSHNKLSLLPLPFCSLDAEVCKVERHLPWIQAVNGSGPDFCLPTSSCPLGDTHLLLGLFSPVPRRTQSKLGSLLLALTLLLSWVRPPISSF